MVEIQRMLLLKAHNAVKKAKTEWKQSVLARFDFENGTEEEGSSVAERYRELQNYFKGVEGQSLIYVPAQVVYRSCELTRLSFFLLSLVRSSQDLSSARPSSPSSLKPSPTSPSPSPTVPRLPSISSSSSSNCSGTTELPRTERIQEDSKRRSATNSSRSLTRV